MASDEPLKTQALLLLSKGYESADERAPFILDGDVARAARVGAVDTPEHAAAVDYLVMEGAVEFVGEGYQHLPRTILYEITERGLEMLDNQGYLYRDPEKELCLKQGAGVLHSGLRPSSEKGDKA